MTFTEKSRTSFQDKLAKQNEISRQILVRELSKLDESKKQDMRMLDTARQRFRSRYKKLGVRAITSSGSEAIDVRMYETHNPGFCYHCTGAIKESGPESLCSINEDSDDSYEFIRAMLFTNGEVDIEKLLCLHILSAHTAKKLDGQFPVMKNNSSSLLEKDEPLSGAWNNFLPCCVVEFQSDRDESTKLPKTNQVTMDNETVKNFELSYERYTRDNSEVIRALKAHDRMSKMAPKTLGKMPIISPHVYSILGTSHEFRVKRSMAEGNSRSNTVNRHSQDSVMPRLNDYSNVKNDEFRLFDGVPNISNRLDVDSTKISAFRIINSQRTSRCPSSYSKLDRSITMLKGKARRNFEDIGLCVKNWQTNNEKESETNAELVTIKPSHRNLGASVSKNSCVKANNHKVHEDRGSLSSINSFNFGIDSPRHTKIKYRKSIYLNSPVKSFALKNHEYRIVDILVNNQIQALVHSVLEVLERVNPEKVRRVLDMARDAQKIRDIFQREDIQNFVESLIDQPIVTSPSSFVVSQATAIDEIDSRLEDFVEDELVATTVELPPLPSLELLVEDIRDNIFDYLEKNSNTMIRRMSQGGGYDESKIVESCNEKCHLKSPKATQDGYLDPDRVILKRMTNSQRILVGRMCAALKNRRINNEGLIRERIPLVALITPALSRESIKMLTRGTIYSKFNERSNKPAEENDEHCFSARTQRLTGPILAKVKLETKNSLLFVGCCISSLVKEGNCIIKICDESLPMSYIISIIWQAFSGIILVQCGLV